MKQPMAAKPNAMFREQYRNVRPGLLTRNSCHKKDAYEKPCRTKERHDEAGAKPIQTIALIQREIKRRQSHAKDDHTAPIGALEQLPIDPRRFAAAPEENADYRRNDGALASTAIATSIVWV